MRLVLEGKRVVVRLHEIPAQDAVPPVLRILHLIGLEVGDWRQRPDGKQQARRQLEQQECEPDAERTSREDSSDSHRRSGQSTSVPGV